MAFSEGYLLQLVWFRGMSESYVKAKIYFEFSFRLYKAISDWTCHNKHCIIYPMISVALRNLDYALFLKISKIVINYISINMIFFCLME